MTENFVEMDHHGSMNWCCGGGGGVSSNERAKELKFTAFNRKKSQIDEINVEKVVTACSNCRMVMEDGVEANEMDIELLGLTEMIAGHLVDDRRGQ
ncbi:MAG: heterodisulfide reductase-related iron-sulfur binding cluster [Gammaproteobacteria bacterium]|nr:heterodisulfide reductase-related iron-sulfur binding cluster [Gammaproteobacteria bacterium]